MALWSRTRGDESREAFAEDEALFSQKPPVAGMLLGGRAGLVTAIGCSLVVLGLAWAETRVLAISVVDNSAGFAKAV